LERDTNELRDAVMSLRDSQQEISKSLQRLVSLEERHMETREAMSRAFGAIEKVNDRLLKIEQDMPGLREVRGWVINGVLTVVAIVGAGVLALVIH